MNLASVDTITFVDLGSGDNALAIVRASPGQIAFCISLAGNGDVEVVFGPTECERILNALRSACLIAEGA